MEKIYRDKTAVGHTTDTVASSNSSSVALTFYQRVRMVLKFLHERPLVPYAYIMPYIHMLKLMTNAHLLQIFIF